MRKEGPSNVILVSGGALFSALNRRLYAELGQVLPASCRHRVVASRYSAEGRYAATEGGGSFLFSLARTQIYF